MFYKVKHWGAGQVIQTVMVKRTFLIEFMRAFTRHGNPLYLPTQFAEAPKYYL